MNVTEELILVGKVIAWIVFIFGGFYLIVTRFLKECDEAQIEQDKEDAEELRQRKIKNRLIDMLTLTRKLYKLAISLVSPGTGEKTKEQEKYWENYELMSCEFSKEVIKTIIEEMARKEFTHLSNCLENLDYATSVTVIRKNDTGDKWVEANIIIKEMVGDNKEIDEILEYFKTILNQNGMKITPFAFETLNSQTIINNTP